MVLLGGGVGEVLGSLRGLLKRLRWWRGVLLCISWDGSIYVVGYLNGREDMQEAGRHQHGTKKEKRFSSRC